MSDVIEGASVSVKTMADGTLRLTIDIEPRNSQAAFILFGAPGRAVALAALKDGAGAAQQPAPPKPREHLGDLCYRAVQWCKEPQFWAFLNISFTGDHVDSEAGAAELLKFVCNVDSRKELDTDADAARLFSQHIRGPYQQYLLVAGRIAGKGD